MRTGLAVAVVLAGCLAPVADVAPSAVEADWPRGVHPWPTGDEWPAGLAGPFSLLSRERVEVPSHDGTPLDGWILLPDVPAGTRLPTVLRVSPYEGQLYRTPDAPENDLPIVPTDLLVEAGYAVAYFSVRGTGHSGGCFSMLGEAERKDQAFLVEWLAAQPWSNGRVGMTGGSYDGTTPWQAAVQNPPALKTIVPVASLADLYLWHHTVNGAAIAIGAPFQTAYVGITSYLPPLLGLPTAATVEHGPRLPERTCDETRRVVTATWGATADDRDELFFEERRIHDEFGGITTSAFIAHGFYDRRSHQGGSMQEDDAYWGALTAPKRAILGPWGHENPTTSDWNDVLIAWFDFWLKGVGDPPKLGLVEFQDTAGDWRETTSWPPNGTRRETLFLAEGALAPSPGAGAATFRAVPGSPEAALCAGAAGVAFLTEPVAEAVLLGGEPFATLNVEADEAGGIVAATLFDVPPEGCATATRISIGAANLRFLHGNYAPEPFPVGEPAPVRLDFHDVAHLVPAGHRIALVLNGGDPRDFLPHLPYAPTIAVHADGEAPSRLVLPVSEGTLGGAEPVEPVPARPFYPVP